MGAHQSNTTIVMEKFFGGLSKYVLLPILIDWLSMNDVCKLDSAICNQAQRSVFLEWLGGENSVTLSGIVHEKYNGVAYWQWLSVRNIHVHHISLFFEYFERDFCGKIIRKSYWDELVYLFCGSKHTQTLNKVVTKEMTLPDKIDSLKLTGLCERDMGRFARLNPVWLLSLTFLDFDLLAFSLNIVAGFVSKHCKSLTELTIHGCGDIPTRAMKDILGSSTELMRLSLLEKRRPGEFKYLPSEEEYFSEWQVNCSKLTYLSFFQVSNVCDTLIKLIASNCPRLQHIALLAMDFDCDCMEFVSTKCRKLISISLETLKFDAILSLSTYEAIAENCSGLEYINIQSGKSSDIAARGVDMLLTQCPRMRFIYVNCNPYLLSVPLPAGLFLDTTRRLSGWYDPYIPQPTAPTVTTNVVK